jgi:hypothetical protein
MLYALRFKRKKVGYWVGNGSDGDWKNHCHVVALKHCNHSGAVMKN